MLCDSRYWLISISVELRAGEFSPITTENLVQGNRAYSVLNLRITSDFREKGVFDPIQKTELSGVIYGFLSTYKANTRLTTFLCYLKSKATYLNMARATLIFKAGFSPKFLGIFPCKVKNI